MSVAENPVTERAASQNPQQQLVISSVLGALILLAGLGFIFAGLPMAWAVLWDSFWRDYLQIVERNDFLAGALLIMIELCVIGGLGYGAYCLLQKYTQRGLRAGIVIQAVVLMLAVWIGFSVGVTLEEQFSDNHAVGWAIVILIIGAIEAGLAYLFLSVPAWTDFLGTLEDQGWVHGISYKGNQGVRVRRGTIIGILAVGITGIIAMVQHHFFSPARGADELNWIIRAADPARDLPAVLLPFTNDWAWTIPFSSTLQTVAAVPILFRLEVTLPLIMGIVLIWFAWRVVNIPVFADFLIATEAEMNKVSWTSRKRLVQDTIVVLVTVFLFTGFLFVVDVIWIKVLSNPYIQVLLLNPRDEAQKQQEKAQW